MRASDIPLTIPVTSTLDSKLVLAGLLAVPAKVETVLDLSKLHLERRVQAYRAICGAVKAGTLTTKVELPVLPDESPRGYVVRDTKAAMVGTSAAEQDEVDAKAAAEKAAAEKAAAEKAAAEKAAAEKAAAEKAAAEKAAAEKAAAEKAAADAAAAKAAEEEAALEAATRPEVPVAGPAKSEIL